MGLFKQAKDRMIKALAGKTVPKGLFEPAQYFRDYDPIEFKKETLDGEIIATSVNFRYGSIITSAKNETKLESNIIDAILTAFDVPSSYAQEAKIVIASA